MQPNLFHSWPRPKGAFSLGAARYSFWIILAAMLVMPALPASSAGQGGFERRILFENASVQVLRLNYPPGAASPLHTHKFPGRTIYVLQGGTMELWPGGDPGKARTITVKAGSVGWRPSETHIVRNTGGTTVSVVEVEIKNLGEGG
jgi:quercetin dioxygenase-like cupin family protein